MGLKFPTDLGQWQNWAEKQNLLRYTKNSLLRAKKPQTQEENLALYSKGSQTPLVLLALEAFTPTQQAALLAPAQELEKQGVAVAVLAPAKLGPQLEKRGWRQSLASIDSSPQQPRELAAIKEVLAVGHYLPAGRWAYEQGRAKGWTFRVVQHGLNTPFAPPLPAESHLFSFSDQDANFWISGRKDLSYTVAGSQLFYQARVRTSEQQLQQLGQLKKEPIFLGQMHGAELRRLSFARAAYTFCKNHHAAYRPHPAEKDILSKTTHKLWAKMGIKFADLQLDLNQTDNPVVSVFSTGVLEAAMRGVPAWVYHPSPPDWLKEFWKRYGMNRWGGPPTPAPIQPAEEPALLIARTIAQQLE